jgi:CBS domain-containing protein
VRSVEIKDLMTSDVISVAPETSLKDVARTLVEHGISGLPVCDADGRVLGVVSEADILYKEQGRPERHGPLGWLLGEPPTEAPAKARARTAGEAMTSPAVTIRRTRPAAAAARLMVETGVNRLPVVSGEGTLLGIVTRADLVRAFTRPDREIAAEIREDVLERVLWVPAGTISVRVTDGEVELSGKLETSAEVAVLEKLVETVPGVVSLRSAVTHELDEPSRAGRLVGLG